ncbi:hypothetical protein KMP13_02180 [Epibacterium ulvae]|uniref:hypothetical protein n=1 Tax=Epibacterium ulvae TaxID=1156985 RepID=UPI001BFC533B|nr:hypothetical protein [Epibacterium ulvae]MBT8152721.1 hypothetical protein [Epibacterium ulvae]
MPTDKQIRDANASVVELHPRARIKSVGPNGIEFEYPDPKDAANDNADWSGKPFSAG